MIELFVILINRSVRVVIVRPQMAPYIITQMHIQYELSFCFNALWPTQTFSYADRAPSQNKTYYFN